MSSIWLYSSKSLEYGHTAVHLIHGEGDAASQPGCWVSLVLLQIQPLWRVHLNQIKINFVSHSNLLTWRTSSLSHTKFASLWKGDTKPWSDVHHILKSHKLFRRDCILNFDFHIPFFLPVYFCFYMAYKKTDIFRTTRGICPFSTFFASHFTSASAHMIAFVIAQLYATEK